MNGNRPASCLTVGRDAAAETGRVTRRAGVGLNAPSVVTPAVGVAAAAAAAGAVGAPPAPETSAVPADAAVLPEANPAQPVARTQTGVFEVTGASALVPPPPVLPADAVPPPVVLPLHPSDATQTGAFAPTGADADADGDTFAPPLCRLPVLLTV